VRHLKSGIKKTVSSRERILGRISKHRPTAVQRKVIKIESEQGINLRGQFEVSLKKVGGKIISIQSVKDWKKWIKITYGTNIYLYSAIDALEGNYLLDTEINKNQLNKIDVAVLEGEFGIAENGAVWVEKFAFRAIPFVTQHLILILRETNIISNMHEAYAELAEFGLPDFGVFISGPSKTADIEQSLVYGAHGPKTLTVILV
jgi:L-lactate dehydrogenase complex protein LldG